MSPFKPAAILYRNSPTPAAVILAVPWSRGNAQKEVRDMSPRAEMLRLFRDVLEDKTIDMEKAGKLLDEDFVKDVDFKGYTDELLLLEVDNMTDMLYE